MRKRLLASFVAAFMLFGIGSALADPGAETGAGKDATCADGTSCPTPTDPTADEANMAPAGPVGIGGSQSGMGGGMFVSVGDEGEANSVGRVSLSGDSGSVGVYGEDYTEGDQIANAVEAVNSGTGCNLIAPEEGSACGDPSDSDAVYAHN